MLASPPCPVKRLYRRGVCKNAQFLFWPPPPALAAAPFGLGFLGGVRVPGAKNCGPGPRGCLLNSC